jgi:hypothetical protein
MSVDNIAERLLNPGVLVSMIGAGIAYGWFLWSLNIRPNVNLWLSAIAPGAMFLLVVWSIRAMQGVASGTYIALLVDWLIFSVAGVVTVCSGRHWRAGK